MISTTRGRSESKCCDSLKYRSHDESQFEQNLVARAEIWETWVLRKSSSKTHVQKRRKKSREIRNELMTNHIT